MNYRQPTQSDLKAFCGWAIIHGHQSVVEAVEAIIGSVPESAPVLATRTERDPEDHVKRVFFNDMPADSYAAIVGQMEVCEHKFSIDTQKCRFCGKTYREAKGRKPELMS